MTDIENLSGSQPNGGPGETTPPHPEPLPPRNRRPGVFLLFLGVMLVAALFRFLNVDWDEGEHLHPDERYMTMVTGAIRSPGYEDPFQNPPAGCQAWGGYFDSYCSPLNPYNHSGYGSYAYGTFPLFGARLVGEWLNGACIDPDNPDRVPPAPLRWIAGQLFDDAQGCTGDLFTDYGHIHLLGRMLSALADLGTLAFTFLIGRRLYGAWVGLLAAGLYALAALPIQQSHFYTVDAFAAFLIAAAGYFAVLGAEHGRWRHFTLAGISFGLALASKVSVWPFAAVIVLAALLYYVRSRGASLAVAAETTDQERPGVLDGLMTLLVVVFCFLVAAIALFGIWSAVKIAFYFAVALLGVGGLVFYVSRPGSHSPTRGFAQAQSPTGREAQSTNSQSTSSQPSIDAVALRLVLAGVVAFLAFRVAQPYAFVGTNFDVARWQSPEYDWLRTNVPDTWYTLNDKMPDPLRALFLPDPRFIGTLASVNKQLTGEADVPWGHQWTNRLPFVFPWVNMVFWGMGLPLGLVAWAGWGLAARELWRGRRRQAHFIPWAWTTILFFYQGTQWVKSIRYLLPIYPFLIILGAWLLVRLWRAAGARIRETRLPRLLSMSYRLPLILVLAGTLLWAWGFAQIYTRPVTRNTASRWMVENIPTAATLHYQVDGAAKTHFLRLPLTVTYAEDGLAQVASFVLPDDGVVTGIVFTHLGDPQMDAEPEGFQVKLAADVEGQTVIAQAERTINLEQAGHRLGDAQRFEFEPTPLRGDQIYYLTTQVTAGAPVRMDTTVIANEYPDDSLPTRVDGLDPFGQMYRGLQSSGDGKTHWDLNEDEAKLAQALEWLDEADIIALSSNRGYASIPRLPSRYPLAITFYEALFAEKLGFELIASFVSYPTIGPFQFPDQETPFAPGERALINRQMGSTSIYLPPAEEAFSVYDHPQVYLFRKTDDYSRGRAEEILGSVELSQVVWQKPTEATLAPTALMHTEEELEIQRSGGTWAKLFDPDSWLNRAPLLSVTAWWLLTQLLGLAAFPLLFVAAPGLRDRGWPLAKTLGLLLLALLVWLAASGPLTYSRAVILFATLLLALTGGAVAAWQHRRLAAWFRRERRAVLIGELLYSGMFLLFLLIRYGNPDLWHPVMGGERPMDFAYLNAVIKSTRFPPYDPWLAGGYMNYYYFGFIIVATPIKLLGILPEIAYNLALPTFFALTGAGAYSLAYNLVASTTANHPLRAASGRPENVNTGSDYAIRITHYALRIAHHVSRPAIYAGLIAALFVAIMGNLTEISLVTRGWHELGARNFEFRSTIPGLEPLVVTLRGAIQNAVGGEPMSWRPEWPYWNASRAIPQPQGEAEPITEFPFFTFLYSDLHAHLLVLPLTLLALGLVANWVLDAGFWRLNGKRRRWLSALLGLVLGGIVVGSLRPTNTWDYATYLALVPLALLVAYSAHGAPALGKDTDRSRSDVRSRGLDLRTIKGAVAAVGGRFALLAGLSYLIFLPYITRFATASTGFDPWKGSKTPLWAYFGVHGLFLFPILTWLLLPLVLGYRRYRASAKPLTEEERLWQQIQAMAAPDGVGRRSGLLWRLLLVLFIVAVLIGVAAGYQVMVIVLPFGVLALLLLLARSAQPAQRLVALLVGVALALTLFVELMVLNTGEVGRMNTVFKFYLQAWVMFGIAAAVCLVWIFLRVRRGVAATAPVSEPVPNPVTRPAALPVPLADAGLNPNPQPLIEAGANAVAEPSLLMPGSAQDGAGTPLPAQHASTNRVSVPVAQADLFRPLWGLWKGILALLILLAALYPLLATWSKINDRWAREIGPGLNSMAWMKAVTDTQFDSSNTPHNIPLVHEYDALMWLRDNVQGSPVVMEGAAAPPYRSLRARIATYTGLPIVIGYPWHQKQQHSFIKADLIDRREREVNDFYQTADPWLAKEILERYDVQLVYVGDLERVHYPPAGIEKFEQMVEMGLLRQVYANPGVRIYVVVR